MDNKEEDENRKKLLLEIPEEEPVPEVVRKEDIKGIYEFKTFKELEEEIHL